MIYIILGLLILSSSAQLTLNLFLLSKAKSNDENIIKISNILIELISNEQKKKH